MPGSDTPGAQLDTWVQEQVANVARDAPVSWSDVEVNAQVSLHCQNLDIHAIRITSLCMLHISMRVQTMQELKHTPVDLLKLAKQLADLPATAAPSVVLEGSSLKRRQIMRY